MISTVILLVVVILLILAAVNFTWPRFHPGWGGLALAAFYYLLQVLGQV